VLASAVLATVACAAPRATPPIPRGASTVSVYVVSHGWHSGIAVRYTDVPEGLWPEAGDFPGAEYIEVGWGDREYYPAPDPGFGMLLKAAFGASPSVVHTVGFRGGPVEQFPDREVVELSLPRSGFEGLVRHIHDTYSRGDASRARRLGPGLYGDSAFYPAVGTFHALRNCNVWTARALRAAGLPVHDRITVRGLMSEVRPLGTVLVPAAP
jgi:uncharacterized protein (TIGR02117 family)